MTHTRASGFSGSRLVALEAIAAGSTMEVAAAAAGVTARMLRYWRGQDPLFGKAVTQAKLAAVEEIQGRVRALVPVAMAVIEEVLSTPNHRDRFRAALFVIDRVAGWARPDRAGAEPQRVTDDPPTLEALLYQTGPLVWPVAETDEAR